MPKLRGCTAAKELLRNSSGEQDYLYNGKEFNEDLGLEWYDYGARYYDPSIGRWNGVDPLAEKHPNVSPFAYVLNSPLLFVDPDGKDNIIYLINLRGSGFRNSDIQKIEAQANHFLSFLGVNTRVKTFTCPPSEFSTAPGDFDPTDAVAVFGKPKDVIDFIGTHLSDIANKNHWEDSPWNTDARPNRPELSEGPAHQGPDGIANVIGINAEAILVSSGGIGMGSDTPITRGAFSLVHGAGHNAGVPGTHDGGRGFMMEGNMIQGSMQSGTTKNLSDFFFGRNWQGALQAMKPLFVKRFQNDNEDHMPVQKQ